MMRKMLEELTKDTLVPLGLVVTLLLSMSGGAVWLNASLSELQYQTELLRRDIQGISDRMTSNAQDRFRRSDMRAWIKLLKATNPELKVPDVD